MLTPISTLGAFTNRMFTPITCVLLLAYLIGNSQCFNFVDTDKYDRELQVDTNNGIIQGFQKKIDNGKFAFIYKGIPFARPPLDDLRFRSPQPLDNWTGVLDGSMFPSSCVEIVIRFSGITNKGKEDCLYLNVYTPIKPTENGNLSVLFWIYGGSFLEGGSKYYNPEYILEENVIVVTSNYRVGMFGFLSTEDKASPGNYGLKDQLAALKWVQKNIHRFGGDPKKVTIIGESAGACAVMYHMISLQSKGLFRGAIAMSGSTLSPWCHQKYPKKIASNIGTYLGLSTQNTTEFIETLRKIDTKSLINSQTLSVIASAVDIYQNGLPFVPVIERNHEDAFVTKSSYALLEKGKFNKVPLIIGVTSMEFSLILKVISLLSPYLLLLDLSPGMIPTAINLPTLSERRIVGMEIKKKYFPSGSILSETYSELTHYLNDVFFVKPMQTSIELITKHIPVYSYVFDYQGQAAENFLHAFEFELERKIPGAGHGEDLAYIWKVSDMNAIDNVVRKRIIKLWSNFAKYGNPTPTTDMLLQNITWPLITNTYPGSYLQIGEDLTVFQNYRESYMQFWDKIFEKYSQKPYNEF